MKLVGYVRVSSDSQSENTSFQSQTEKLQAYCLAMGHEIVEVYKEVGSGKSAESRPVFQKALQALQNADGLIVAKLDRLARSARDVLTLVETNLEPYQKSLVLLDLQLDTSTPQGKMILTTMAGIAEMERSIINERTQGGRKAKAEKGGYAYGKPAYGWKSNENKELEKDESEQKIIEIIRKHKKSGKSLRKIADYLNQNGYKTKQGKDWGHTSVNSVLKRLKAKK